MDTFAHLVNTGWSGVSRGFVDGRVIQPSQPAKQPTLLSISESPQAVPSVVPSQSLGSVNQPVSTIPMPTPFGKGALTLPAATLSAPTNQSRPPQPEPIPILPNSTPLPPRASKGIKGIVDKFVDSHVGHQEHSSISLLNFCRLYTFANVPIIDFIVIYLILYLANHFTFKYKFRTILFLTIILTICINLLVNPETTLSLFIIVCVIFCLYYLLFNEP